jgi:hypothetical protein
MEKKIDRKPIEPILAPFSDFASNSIDHTGVFCSEIAPRITSVTRLPGVAILSPEEALQRF